MHRRFHKYRCFNIRKKIIINNFSVTSRQHGIRCLFFYRLSYVFRLERIESLWTFLLNLDCAVLLQTFLKSHDVLCKKRVLEAKKGLIVPICQWSVHVLRLFSWPVDNSSFDLQRLCATDVCNENLNFLQTLGGIFTVLLSGACTCFFYFFYIFFENKVKLQIPFIQKCFVLAVSSTLSCLEINSPTSKIVWERQMFTKLFPYIIIRQQWNYIASNVTNLRQLLLNRTDNLQKNTAKGDYRITNALNEPVKKPKKLVLL